MIILKQIRSNLYDFDILLQSKSVHAHSLISDNKEVIEKRFEDFFKHFLEDLIEEHKELKK